MLSAKTMKSHIFLQVVSAVVLPVILGDMSSDRQALLEFTSKVPHSRGLNWDAASSVCTSWVGISCNKDHTRVTVVRLPGVGFLGCIPGGTIGKLDALRVLSLRSNYFYGDLPSDIPSITSLQFLFLQDNNFSGSIPESFSPRLVALDLSSNLFSGHIPTTLQNLTNLGLLHLQDNQLSGSIPYLDLPRLKLLNLSHNKLSGSVPRTLQKYPSSSFVDNSLCGPPLGTCSSISTKAAGKKLGKGCVIGIVCGLCLLVIMVAMLLWCLKMRGHEEGEVQKEKNKKIQMSSEAFGSGIQDGEKNKLVFFEGCGYNFDVEDLLRASAEVLGKGSYGTAYKAILDEGTTVVVKRVKEVGLGRREFEQNMEIMSKVGQHPNVVPLRAYYFSKDEKLLVYDYVRGGSLGLILHGYRGNGRSPVSWRARMNILGDVAKGILHIHSEGGGKLIHGNIKASNVLLTPDLDAGLLSDFGVTQMMINLPGRSVGYAAPEVLESRKGSQKSDVYSFGVLVLEMLTGKAPHGHNNNQVIDLPRWVQSVVREEWTSEVFDSQLLKSNDAEEEMVQVLQIALACVGKLPELRPTMGEVVRMIQDLLSSNSNSNSNVCTP